MTARRSSKDIVARIDGASRGNPGPAGYGVIIETNEGRRLAELKKVLGQTTNNVAEYQALLAALAYALSHRHLRLKVISDSELLTRQMEGRYKVKSPDLKPLHERTRQMIARLEAFSIEHVPRDQNREADRLANQALDATEGRAGLRPAPPVSPPALLERLRASATYQQGVLKPHQELPLAEGEEVDLELRRKKSHAH